MAENTLKGRELILAWVKEITLGIHFTSILVLFVLFFAKLDYQFHCVVTMGISFIITVSIPPFGVHTVPFFGARPGEEPPVPDVELIRNKFKVYKDKGKTQ